MQLISHIRPFELQRRHQLFELVLYRLPGIRIRRESP